MRRIPSSTGVRLAVTDSGSAQPSAMLLHGLAGHAGEWAASQTWLQDSHRVVAFDQRGHGRSDPATDMSIPAFVADTVHVIDRLDLAPVLLVGHSLG